MLTVVLTNKGDVRCWGDGRDGALGIDNILNIGDDEHPSDSNVVLGWPVAQVSAGINHSCAMSLDGRGRCWGRNNNGQLGQDNTINIGDGAGTAMSGLTDIDFGWGVKISSINAATLQLAHYHHRRPALLW